MAHSHSNIVELRPSRSRVAFETFVKTSNPAAILDFNVAQNKYTTSDVQRLWQAWQAGVAYEKSVRKARGANK